MRTFLVSIVFPIFSVWVVSLTAHAQPAVSTDQGKAGSHVLLSATNLPVSGNVAFWLGSRDDEVQLAQATVVRGRVSVRALLPDFEPGNYPLELRQRDAVVATWTFDIVAPGVLSISPAAGPAGTLLNISLEGLEGDSFALFFDEQKVRGPEPLGRTTTIQWEVPEAPATGIKTVRISTQTGPSVIDLAAAEFNQTPTLAIEPPRLLSAAVTRNSVTGLYELTGRLLPRSGEDTEGYELSLVFTSTDGTVIPVPAVIDLDLNGNLQAEFSDLSVFDNQVTAAGIDGDFTLAVVIPDNSGFGGTTHSKYELAIESTSFVDDTDTPLTVRVESLTGEPIEGATVFIKAGTPITPAGAAQLEYQSSWSAAVNQGFFGQNADSQTIPECGAYAYKDVANANGEASFQIDPVDFTQLTLKRLSQCEPISTPTSQQIDCDLLIEIPIVVWVSAKNQGHGWLVDGQWVGGVYVLMLKHVAGIGQLFGFHDPALLSADQFNDLSLSPAQLLDPEAFTRPIDPINPLTFKLPAIPPLQQALPQPISATLNIEGLIPSSDNIGVDTFEGPFSLLRNNQLVNAEITAEDLTISFPEPGIESQYAGVRLEFDDVDYGLMSRSEASQCAADPFTGESSTLFSATLPAESFYTKAPGSVLEGQIVATDLLGRVEQKRFSIEVSNQVPAWIGDSGTYENRSVRWSPGGVKLSAAERTTMAADISPDLDYDIGTLGSSTGNGGNISQEISLQGAGQIFRSAASVNALANTEGDDQHYFKGATNDTGLVQIGPSTVDILDTGFLPLFRYGWDFWPIASATLGADLWLRAELAYKTTINLLQNSYQLEVTPRALVDLKLFFDASILFDVVKAHAEAISGVDIRVKVTNTDGAISRDPCFQFDLDVAYEINVGICPLCVGSDGIKELIQEGSCSSAKDASPLAIDGIASPGPRSVSPSLAYANNGLGLLIYAGEDGQYRAQQLELGEIVSAPTLFDDVPGLMDVQIKFIDGQTAILVAAMNALTTEDFLAQPFSEVDSQVTRSQHIVHGRWESGSFSSFQPLTEPSTGEGSPVLATCYSSALPCTGPLATAVWVKDMAGDIGAYRSQVFFATLTAQGWNAPRPVDPNLLPGDPVKDGQPSVTFWASPAGTVPVISWVRNPSGSLADLGSRHLMFRVLDGSNEVEALMDLPRGIASPTLTQTQAGELVMAFTVASDPNAFIGDQRTLHWARYECNAECRWTSEELNDPLGRRIRSERPQLVTDNQGTAVVFRLLGYANADGLPNALPGDPLGSITGAGTTALLYLDIPELQAPDPIVQVFDPSQFNHWDIAAAFDPSSGLNVVNGILDNPVRLNGRGLSAKDLGAAVRTRAKRTAIDGERGALMRLPAGLDISVDLVTVQERAQQSITVRVMLSNFGMPTTMPLNSTPLSLSWNGLLGNLGSRTAQASCAPDGPSQVLCDVSIPADFADDENFSLVAIALPQDDAFADSNLSNNQFTLQLDMEPVQGEVVVRSGGVDGFKYVSWNGVTSASVAGYRVYRGAPGSRPVPVGYSLTNEWVDQQNRSASDVQYWVTAYSDRGFESPLSSPSSLVAPNVMADGIVFGDGFEGP